MSIFLGGLLLLAPRRGGAPAMAVPRPAALRDLRRAPGPSRPTPGATRPHEPVGKVDTRSAKTGDPMEALERHLREADARLKAVYSSGWLSGGPGPAS
ncbi:MAG TPA: hypothetical protein VFK43_05455 [Acidimicrobiales bacterium]|nr:hypothetical protein [Acidimicrobiales bacterium]